MPKITVDACPNTVTMLQMKVGDFATFEDKVVYKINTDKVLILGDNASSYVNFYSGTSLSPNRVTPLTAGSKIIIEIE